MKLYGIAYYFLCNLRYRWNALRDSCWTRNLNLFRISNYLAKRNMMAHRHHHDNCDTLIVFSQFKTADTTGNFLGFQCGEQVTHKEGISLTWLAESLCSLQLKITPYVQQLNRESGTGVWVGANGSEPMTWGGLLRHKQWLHASHDVAVPFHCDLFHDDSPTGSI